MPSTFLQQHDLPMSFVNTVEQYYLPLANKLTVLRKQKIGKHDSSPLFVGINGCQGSGKSTLVAWLAAHLEEQKLSVVVLSLDDFYLSQVERDKLAAKIHPLLTTRGVPGTHDTVLLKQVLQRLKTINNPANSTLDLKLPRFDKAQDNPLPKAKWPTVSSKIDIVLFEGWCWGVMAQEQQGLNVAVNSFERNHDPEFIWRNYVNQRLAEHYQPLYSVMDFWLMLKAPSFDVVYQWRLQQEQKLARVTKQGAKGVMNENEISEFIQYFQRLTEHSLKELPSKVNVLFELNERREIVTSSGLYQFD